MNAESLSSLGRYRLVKMLGQGSMGVVHEAVDTRLGRTVAIKTVLRSRLADASTADDFAQRFEREAQAAARLNHPHIVAIFDFGEEGDASFIVMELIKGRELAQAFTARQTFSLAETVRIMCELLAALGYAHEQGIVHRDIKPENVMIDSSGHVKLMDFGVARVVDTGQNSTLPGTVVGTLGYMSPEQILGLAVGTRTDLFAAGVVLYQFLTGQRPFTGAGLFEVQRKIVQDVAVPPSQMNADVPSIFDHIVARALAKLPADRYDSAAAFAADLQRALATVLPPVPPPQMPAPAAIDLDATVITQWPRDTLAQARTQTGAEPLVPAPLAGHSGTATRQRWPPIAPRLAALLLTAVALAVGLLVTRPWQAGGSSVRVPVQPSSPPSVAVEYPATAPTAAPAVAVPAAVAPATIVPSAPPVLAVQSSASAPAPAPSSAAAPTPHTAPTAHTPPAIRPPTAAPTRATVRENTPIRPAANDPRCAELLQRMQLGDALTPEQTTVFHTRCVR